MSFDTGTVTTPEAARSPRVAWSADLRAVLCEVAAERARQHTKWGEQNHPDVDVVVAGMPAPQAARYAASLYGIPTALAAKAETDAAARASACSWSHIAVEELAALVEAAALGDEAALRTGAIQLAAVCVQLVQDIDRRGGRR